MINFRTDLALERRDLFKKANNISNEVDGLETQEESFTDDIKISRVKVLNDNGEQAIGKRKGTYITIDIKNLKIARFWSFFRHVKKNFIFEKFSFMLTF